jgi:hypothetical protein
MFYVLISFSVFGRIEFRRTQGLALSKQILYHLSRTPRPLYFIFWVDFTLFAQAGLGS